MASTFISADDQLEHDPTLPPEPRYARRLSDKILFAFHQACDQGDIEVAGSLLSVLEFMMTRPRRPPDRERRSAESLVAAHERLWLLRNPPWMEC
jgi:hypothetical protein